MNQPQTPARQETRTIGRLWAFSHESGGQEIWIEVGPVIRRHDGALLVELCAEPYSWGEGGRRLARICFDDGNLAAEAARNALTPPRL